MVLQTANIQNILNEMKNGGINSAFLRQDGVVIHSTITLEEAGGNAIANVANVSDAIMKKAGDKQKEVEISVDGLYLIIIPIETYFLCGMIKDREQKKTLRSYAEKIRQNI